MSVPWSHNCVYTIDGRVLQRLRLGHIQNICMMVNTLIWRPSKFAHSGGEGGKSAKNKQTSIWRPSSQTAGCIKGPVCLFRMDPVTFTHPRAGRARTNSVTALERRVQRREKSLVCLPEEVTWPALFHTPYVRKKKSLCFCFCGETDIHTKHFVVWVRIGWASHQWGEGGVRMNCARDASCFAPASWNIALFFYFQCCKNKVSLSVSHDSGL